ncbi:unnamed protein product [Owenia fusiformis]|uniref:U5 small nuclear ribonucleoprotein TSSC4 n=1 Tax=Owenia fusiformis TaxID=6347 RepID=A0A8J1Y321_OWEFU|nr:unnamed protein product [Owenia fusiformis]
MPIPNTLPQGYSVKGTSDFKSRSEDIFASLGALEEKAAVHNRYDSGSGTSSSSASQDSPSSSGSSSRLRLSQPRVDSDSKSSFKRPRSPPSNEGRKYDYYFKRPGQGRGQHRSQNKLPDHKGDSKKWKKYSLHDVKTDQMSEEANTNAALSFLATLKDRHTDESDNKMDSGNDTPKTDSESASCSGKVVFKKPVKDKQESSANEPTGQSSSSATVLNANFGAKHVMPEYKVGASKAKKKKKSQKSSLNCDKVNLGHLMDDEDEEND